MDREEITNRIRNLLTNEDFQKVFIDEFINNRAKQLVLNEDVNSEEVRIKLKSIKDFRDFIDYYFTLDNK